MVVREVVECVEAVPEYSRFPLVDELTSSTRELGRRFSDRVEVFEVSCSRSGDPILATRIGRGSRVVLALGLVYPDDPASALALDYLSWYMVKRPEVWMVSDTTWIIVKVVDALGARFNEEWFRDVSSVEKLILNHYVPPPSLCVESTFPIEYKELRWSKPLPETEAIMKLVNDYKPQFIFQFRSCFFRGLAYYLSRHSPELYRYLRAISERFKLPLYASEFRPPYVIKLDTAVYRVPRARDYCDVVESVLGRVPVDVLKFGGSSGDFIEGFSGDVLEVVAEVPYVVDERISDTAPTGIPRREVFLLSLRKLRFELRNLRKNLEILRKYVSSDNPYYEALDHMTPLDLVNTEIQDKWIKSHGTSTESATVADIVSSYVVHYLYTTALKYGLLHQCIRYETTRGRTVPSTIKGNVVKKVEKHLHELNSCARYRKVSIRNVVQTCLYTMLMVVTLL
ncbi:MAG: hypothetical protein DRJ40_04995 [Thermoprotei archaeon]|nr:MAG: hypothetical protein DRJ40_04530 [Thermoprotei archaeon]RLE56756.1 MAG: hypothetical protein DRJ40_04995 [Thermoprotei archaeon]